MKTKYLANKNNAIKVLKCMHLKGRLIFSDLIMRQYSYLLFFNFVILQFFINIICDKIIFLIKVFEKVQSYYVGFL
ncbi:hypothetical protein pb186bvf_003636 [Paramecium bursaria]